MEVELKIPVTISEKEMKDVCAKLVTEMKSRGDLVYVVRCKDCKNYIDENVIPFWTDILVVKISTVRQAS